MLFSRRKIKLSADAAQIVRALFFLGVLTALGVYAIASSHNHSMVAVVSAAVLLTIVGVMLHVSHSIHEVHHQRDQLAKAAGRAERHHFMVLRRILASIESREEYTFGRSRRISGLVRQMGVAMGLDHRQCRLLSMAGEVHDIGLLAVPDAILHKRGKLGAREYRAVQQHSEASYRILQPLTFLADVLPAVRYHHERMNGTGYPFELVGDKIPLLARILAVADAYDAMTHDRPQRAALTQLEALNELRRCTPAGYDAQCVAALEKVMNVAQMRAACGQSTDARSA